MMIRLELRAKRLLILRDIVDQYSEEGTFNLEDALDEMELLDAQCSILRPAFYAMIDQLDARRLLLLASQGNEAQQAVVIDMIIDLLTHYAESLKGVTA